ncbi:hypothetical protein ACFSE3_10595 [Peribacillus frigoritolerans]|uniref:hypothetical protein n=1 Tax=Peribacillus frigoritolerans TaxID=450367 RepID=UPI0007BEE4B2|nr:hypothetical protein [Peribacillus frigoritolerans]
MSSNPFVDYLNQFNVLSPNHSKIYDEYTYEANGNNFSFTIETKIESHLISIFKNEPHSVILTGNAGDGKTRLCRSIYNNFSTSELNDWPDEGIIDLKFDKGIIRFVKDLSELKEEVIENELSKLQSYIQNNHQEKIYYLIAANEGKLTKFLSQNSQMNYLKESVRERLKTYTNNTQQFSIFNLLDVTSSLYVDKVLEEWNKESNWELCSSCTRKKTCIIQFNHEKTSKEQVKDRLVEQYRLLDYLGTHITMRELLIHISYVLTGGFDCSDIQNARHGELAKQMDRPFYENFYGHGIEAEAFSEMRALKAFREVDPGNYSISNIDDFIVNGDLSSNKKLEEIHREIFNADLDLKLGYFIKKLDIYRNHNKESNDNFVDEWINKLRRKFYFEFPEESLFNRKSLIPFDYITDFGELFDNAHKQGKIKKALITGLNRAFSKKLVDPSSDLLATNDNLMIHGTYKMRNLKILPENARLEMDHRASKFFLSVDEILIPMDLHLFEYLMRLNSGNTHNLLREDVEILLDTFKNELIKFSEPDPDYLSILRYDNDKGMYIEDEILIP